jgi:LysR family glycine cleavage system transcriptional activator
VSQHVRALEDALGIELFRRKARSIELTAAGARYLPPIRDAFELISEATETNAPALRGLKFRVGNRVRRAESGLSRRAAIAHAQGQRTDGRPQHARRAGTGRRWAYPRPAAHLDKSCSGLTIERVRIRNGAERFPAVLVTRPGLAGCRQHRALVKLLYG